MLKTALALTRLLQPSRCISASQATRAYSLLGFLKGDGGDPDSTVEVSVIDPRTVLEHDKWKDQDQQQLSVTLKVPRSFLPLLSQGTLELGDKYDPANDWYFGKRGELFQYHLVGTHLTKSGYSSMLLKDELAAIAEGGRTAGLPSWRDFAEDLQAGKTKFPSPRHPFLFVGLMVDTSEAAVYQLKREGQLRGVVISSEAMGGGGDDD